MSSGLSVVICCHNSAGRLPSTLACLAAQSGCETVPWEVMIVDNASTDGTAEVAGRLWPVAPPAPLRIVSEPRLGTAFARYRGLSEARYDYVGFVDDDNWVFPDWVRLAVETMAAHPEVGACGSFSEAACEVSPPAWFDAGKNLYAIGPDGLQGGDVTLTRGLLWSAGMVLRKAAWQQLANNGFHCLLTGRQGMSLAAGEDSELCLALRAAGWRLWYEPRLRFQHFLPAWRLEWGYLRRLYRGAGKASVRLEPYYHAVKPARTGLRKQLRRLRESWQWEFLADLLRLLCQPHKLFASSLYPLEGDTDILELETRLGRMVGLLQLRGAIRLATRDIRKAPWRHPAGM